MDRQRDDDDRDSAQARLRAILRAALPAEEDGLDDATRRLMLHLAHTPVEGAAVPSATTPDDAKGQARPATLLARFWRRPPG